MKSKYGSVLKSKYDTDDFELRMQLTWTRTSPQIDCGVCDGVGEVFDHVKIGTIIGCYNCCGTGKVYANDDAQTPEIPLALINDMTDAWENHNHPKKICPKCDGYGEWDDAELGDIRCNTYTCDKCEGTGKVAVENKKESICECCKGTGYDGSYMCDCCSGTGVEPKVFKCRECKGTGQMDDPQTRYETKIECCICDGTGEIEK